MNNLTSFDYAALLSGSDITKAQFQTLIGGILELSSITEGSGVPTYRANKHSQYFDTSTNKYYRNVDGGTTWVALN